VLDVIYPVQLVVPASDAVLILSLMHVSFQLGGGLGGGFAPPPQAQHMALDVKSASSYEPHQEGLPQYSAHVSPSTSAAPLSVLLQELLGMKHGWYTHWLPTYQELMTSP